METNTLNEAQNAVRAIGAGKALPEMLRLAAATDGPIRRWSAKQNEKWEIRALKFKTAEDKQLWAIAGFEALETNCAAAIPELSRLLNDPDHAFTAALLDF